jgi:hypothetical protein
VVLAKRPGPRALARMFAQRELLNTLAARGYPVADMQVGMMRGQPAFVQDRFVIHSHDLTKMKPAKLRQFVSKTTLADLRRMEAITVKTKTGIDGFQFGVFADHHVRINDPRNVYTGPVRGRLVSRALTLRRIRAAISAVELALAE